MSELMKRLRRLCKSKYLPADKDLVFMLYKECADEIERLEKERDEAQQENFKNGPWIDDLIKERDELRAIFPEICRAIGNGAGCTEQASVEFLREIPKEIAAVIGDLKARLAKYEGAE